MQTAQSGNPPQTALQEWRDQTLNALARGIVIVGILALLLTSPSLLSAERTGELEAEIEKLVADRARYEYELSDYEQTVAAYGY